jgi:hypothetical protein
VLDVIEGALAADQVGAILARLRQIVGVHQRLEILEGRGEDAVAAADDVRPLLAQDHLAGDDVPVEQGLARAFDRERQALAAVAQLPGALLDQPCHLCGAAGDEQQERLEQRAEHKARSQD